MPHSARRVSDSIGTNRLFNECAVLLLTAAVALSGLVLPGEAAARVAAGDRVDGKTPRELGVPRNVFPDVSMDAGALVTSDGRVLWTRRATERRAFASITKIMTAVIAMEHGALDETVTVSERALRVGESTSYLRAGERLPLSELLEALLIKSGNDASVAIAIHISGSEDEFVRLMNDKAAELGLASTRFANSHGLDQRGHYSTAGDLEVLTRYAMTKPLFRRIVSKKRARIGSGSRAHRVENTNLLIGNYTGANGVKTGFTSDAGYCLVGSAQRDDVELVAVVLGTSSDTVRVREARELLDFGFAHYRPQRLASGGTVIAEAPVADYLDLTVSAAVSEDTTVAILDFAGPISRTVRVASVRAPIARGDKVGVVTFTQGGEVVATVPLVATEAVKRPNPIARVGIALARLWRRLVGAS